ncbi:MAG: hypothetical protein NZ961_00535, partial [Candidatus Poribacteria bacterium]|nr:hypothetical protein [Candidatus Poribacteria bacterium]
SQENQEEFVLRTQLVCPMSALLCDIGSDKTALPRLGTKDLENSICNIHEFGVTLVFLQVELVVA